jgi:hypothetical protein
MAEGADGFLGRWARRKNDALQGKPLDEPASAPQAGNIPPPVTVSRAENAGATLPAESTAMPAPAAEDAEPLKPLTLDDVKDLTKDSDFKPFMNSGVEPSVRNAAMKKLFADPHFNVMDRLDIYIDDYSQPDPLPLSMLRQMASAKFLNLFDEEEEDSQKAKEAPENATAENAEAARETAHMPPDDSVAQSESAHDEPDAVAALSNPSTQDTQEDHAHIDLRLQPDHAPEGPDTGRGAA